MKLVKSIDLNICPYRGLQAFREEDSQYFYGRETFTQQIIAELGKKSFIAVVGASCSGKSSLVQAGVMAQLRQGKQLLGTQDWWINGFRPGANPLAALCRCLVDSAAEEEKPYQQMQLPHIFHQGGEEWADWVKQRPEPMVVLVIDQFEELFTQAASEDRQRFLEIVLTTLAQIPEKLKLIITLRADFIAPCLEVPTLAQLLQQSSIFLPPGLSQEEYRRIILQPAKQVGLTVESDLLEALLQELDYSPGYLPLLEFVLQQLWEYREHGVITLQAYQQYLGGIKGALEKTAQAVYDSLEPEAQECARWIFLTLTQLGEGTEDTKRRVLKSELVVKKYPAALVERTLQILIAAKLVVVNVEDETIGELEKPGRQASNSPPTSSSPIPCVTVEVAHEILIRHWSTLRCWLEENRSKLRSQRQIEQAANLWQQHHRQAEFLLQGVRLAEAEEIYLNYTDELSLDAQNYIAASLQERRRQQLKEQNRLRRAQRAIAIISTLGLTAFGLAVFAYQKTQTAQLQEIQAVNSLSRNYLLSHQQLEALLAGVQAGREVQRINFGLPVDVRNQTATILQQAVYSTQERNRFLHNSWVTSVSFSPDGEILAAGSADNTIKIWHRNGNLMSMLTNHTDGVNSVMFSPDGKMLASGSADNTIKLWNRSGQLLTTLKGHTRAVNSVSFSPDSRIIVSGSADNTIKLWTRDGQLILTLNGHQGGVNSVSFSPEGDTIASASDDGTIKLWSLDGRLLTTIPAHTQEVWSVTFSQDGKTIASASADHTVKLWTRDGTLLRTLEGHNEDVWRVIFSPDAQMIATASADKTIKIWSMDGNLLETFLGHKHEVNSLSFSPDGKILAAASHDNTVRLWNVERTVPKTFDGDKSSVNRVSFINDGNSIASLSADYTIKLWTLDGKLTKTLTAPIPDVASISLSADGNRVALAGADQRIQIRDRNGTLLHTMQNHSHWVTSMSFSPDNQLIAVGSADKTIKLWTVQGSFLHTLSGHNGWVTDIKFTPDGKRIISASADKTIKIWNLNGKLLNTLQGHSASVWSVNISPDGQTIASASQDETIKLWNLDGELLNTLEGHNDLVFNVSFSPDGKTLASASDDGRIKLWNVANGTLLKTLPGHQGGVKSVSFSPNGKLLVSGGQDSTVKLWNLEGIELQTPNLDQLLNQACDRLADYLTTNPNITTEDYQLCFGD
uniref:nSTAND1 domain-containing NTPase n=1 Tax=Anabaena sp. 4-3 TaxID=1811979 RepID=UPI000A5046E6|nr:hypothetical protein [Anabaena sp. 4-3]